MNRTTMELKHPSDSLAAQVSRALNRTTMELKHGMRALMGRDFDDVESNHYGIETYSPYNCKDESAFVESNHYGIETLAENASQGQENFVESNHYGIETAQRTDLA